MNPPRPDAVRRVQAHLHAHGCDAEVVELPGGTHTAADAAKAVGCDVERIAKSIVFRTASGRPVLVVASGKHRVDEAKVAALLGEAVGKAEREFRPRRRGRRRGPGEDRGFSEKVKRRRVAR